MDNVEKTPITAKLRNGMRVIFTEAENGKYSFGILENPNATAFWLARISTKTIRLDKRRYVLASADELFKSYDPQINYLQENAFNGGASGAKNAAPANDDYMSALGLACQKRWGANIKSEITGKWGEDHNPTVRVCVTMPNGDSAEATGGNQKEARQKAARCLFEEYFRK